MHPHTGTPAAPDGAKASPAEAVIHGPWPRPPACVPKTSRDENEKGHPPARVALRVRPTRGGGRYFFLALAAGFAAEAALRFSSIAACAAARRATGTRNGEQLT